MYTGPKKKTQRNMVPTHNRNSFFSLLPFSTSELNNGDESGILTMNASSKQGATVDHLDGPKEDINLIDDTITSMSAYFYGEGSSSNLSSIRCTCVSDSIPTSSSNKEMTKRPQKDVWNASMERAKACAQVTVSWLSSEHQSLATLCSYKFLELKVEYLKREENGDTSATAKDPVNVQESFINQLTHILQENNTNRETNLLELKIEELGVAATDLEIVFCIAIAQLAVVISCQSPHFTCSRSNHLIVATFDMQPSLLKHTGMNKEDFFRKLKVINELSDAEQFEILSHEDRVIVAPEVNNFKLLIEGLFVQSWEKYLLAMQIYGRPKSMGAVATITEDCKTTGGDEDIQVVAASQSRREMRGIGPLGDDQRKRRSTAHQKEKRCRKDSKRQTKKNKKTETKKNKRKNADSSDTAIVLAAHSSLIRNFCIVIEELAEETCLLSSHLSFKDAPRLVIATIDAYPDLLKHVGIDQERFLEHLNQINSRATTKEDKVIFSSAQVENFKRVVKTRLIDVLFERSSDVEYQFTMQVNKTPAKDHGGVNIERKNRSDSAVLTKRIPKSGNTSGYGMVDEVRKSKSPEKINVFKMARTHRSSKMETNEGSAISKTQKPKAKSRKKSTSKTDTKDGNVDPKTNSVSNPEIGECREAEDSVEEQEHMIPRTAATNHALESPKRTKKKQIKGQRLVSVNTMDLDPISEIPPLPSTKLKKKQMKSVTFSPSTKP